MNLENEISPALTVSGILPSLTDAERERLGDAVEELFHHQAILRRLSRDAERYDWTRLHLAWVRDLCGLLGFNVYINEDEQMIYALPRERATLRKLRLEQTLILLGLWYDYDMKLRAEGAPVMMSVTEFNESLKTKLGERLINATALRETLSLLAGKKMVAIEYLGEFPEWRMEILPTLRLVIPFDDLQKVAESLQLLAAGAQGGETEEDHG